MAALSGPAELPSWYVPAWVVRGIAAQETRSRWSGVGEIRYVDRRDGAAGEVGPWQISPVALSTLGAYHLRDRIRQEPLLAESITRAWLLHLHDIVHSWPAAVRAYNAGLAGRSCRAAQLYLNHVLILGNAKAKS